MRLKHVLYCVVYFLETRKLEILNRFISNVVLIYATVEIQWYLLLNNVLYICCFLTLYFPNTMRIKMD